MRKTSPAATTRQPSQTGSKCPRRSRSRAAPMSIPSTVMVRPVRQTVCRTGLTITVDGIDMGAARERDRRGHLLPVWLGCRVVAAGEVFLMNWDEPASLDGRYFGPIPLRAIVGRAEPLWTFEED